MGTGPICKGTTVDGSAERKVIVHFSQDPYHSSFMMRLDMQRYHVYGNWAGGMVFNQQGNPMTLKDMLPQRKMW